MEDFRIINGELARYGEPEGRPQLVVLNKCDLIYEVGEIQRLKQAFEAMGYEAFPVSAAQNRGFDALLDRVVQLLGELPPPRVFEAEEAEESHVLPDDGFTIRRENDTFYVEGAAHAALCGQRQLRRRGKPQLVPPHASRPRHHPGPARQGQRERAHRFHRRHGI